MKRRIISIVGVLFFALIPLFAQEEFRPRFMAGVTGGVNLSNMIFQPKVEQRIRVGYDAGLVLRYDATEFAGIWLEVDFSNRGWLEKPVEHPDLYYERTLRFVNVPVMTHIMIGKGPLKVTVDAGAHFGYLMSEHSKGNFPETAPSGVIVKQHSMAVENKLAWGIGGGVGTEYHKERYVAGVRASYVYGLGEIYGNSRKDYFGKSSEQVVAVKLYLLYKF